jgi:two-component system response regulator AtoC
MAKILIIDDEPSILESLEMFWEKKGTPSLRRTPARRVTPFLKGKMPEVVMLDIRLPDSNGLDLLSQIRNTQHLAKVIMMTAFQDMETTIDAMKRGAYDYIHKPLDAELVEKTVNSALHVLKVDRETPQVKEEELPRDKDVIIGKSENMRRIFKMIGLVCQNRATVLIQGETGTGKELIARTIHRNCRFSNEPFVTMDCSASVETLLESELFGHEKGAFTGATATKKGRIELAGKGTLFLDELGELPLRLQSKFLGFLQRREFTRVGGHEIMQSRCRIIGATNRDLARHGSEEGIQGRSLLSPSRSLPFKSLLCESGYRTYRNW